MPRDPTELKVDDLTAVYAAAAASHGRASGEGDHRTANRDYHVLVRAWREVRGRDGGRDAMLGLLDHVDPSVRLWAATHVLEFDAVSAERTLEELVTDGGLTGFDAETVLKEWRNGRLGFP